MIQIILKSRIKTIKAKLECLLSLLLIRLSNIMYSSLLLLFFYPNIKVIST